MFSIETGCLRVGMYKSQFSETDSVDIILKSSVQTEETEIPEVA